MRKISVIIPVYNDAKRFEPTIKRLVAIREETYPNLQIIASVRKSTDATEEVARRYADEVVEGGRVSAARNAGARVATGEVLVFLDADALPHKEVFPEIARVVDEKTIGTCTAVPQRKTWKAVAAMWLYNFVRWSGILKGVSNLLFCHRELFMEKHIQYDENLNVGEHADLIARARREGGARYVYLRIPGGGYELSTDRYDRWGYLKTFFFWVKWIVLGRLLRGDLKRLEEEYWST